MKGWPSLTHLYSYSRLQLSILRKQDLRHHLLRCHVKVGSIKHFIKICLPSIGPRLVERSYARRHNESSVCCPIVWF